MKNPITNITNGRLTRKGGKKSISRRGLLAAPLLIAIVALAAVALVYYAPAQAQTATTLISNTGQTTDDDNNLRTGRAQRFTTGANRGGYNLASIDLLYSIGETDASEAAIFTVNSSGYPDTEVASLTAPGSFSGTVRFTASTDILLAPESDYTVVITPAVDGDFVNLKRTSSDNEDDGGADGWSIRNTNDIFSESLTRWQQAVGGRALMVGIQGILRSNTAPTAVNKSVTVPHNTRYTFEADDFNFSDPDPGSALGKVKIVTLPTAGTLTLDGTAVTANDEITRSDIDDDKLVFTPATDATGSPYTTFTFKVNDGDAESMATYTMTVNVGAACAAPTYTGDHVQIWTGALTVGNFTAGGNTFDGFSTSTDPDTGALAPAIVRVGSTDYTATTVVVQGTGTDAERLSWVFETAPSDTVLNTLTVHVCNKSFRLREFTGGGAGRYLLANTGLDWSAATKRTIYISRDTTIPTLQSAVVNSTSLTLTYNEDLFEGGTKSNDAFDITVGTTAAVNPSSFTISGKKVTLTLANAVTDTDTVTLAYTKPGTATQRVQDLAGNQAVALTSQAVTNETRSVDATLSALTVSPGTVNGFAADRTSYEVGVASTVTQATVTATKNHEHAEVEITPADSDGATGHQVDLSAGQNTVTIVVTAEDDATTETYTVNINQGVTTPKGWKAVDDFDTLVASDANDNAGIWSNGTTMWVADQTDDKIYAFTTATKARDSSKDFETFPATTNVWSVHSDGTTMWVLDSMHKSIYAYNLTTKARESGKEFTTLDAAGNDAPSGIWSDGTTMWVTDPDDNRIYAYNMDTKARDSSKEFNTLRDASNTLAIGLWSNGDIMWVTDLSDDKIYAYRMNDKSRDSSKDINTPGAVGNGGLQGIWSDGTTMWVSDNGDNKLYSYNMPAQNADATLSAITVSPKDIIGFDADRESYEVGVASTVAQATVSATVNDEYAEVVITPADAVIGTDGHQVTLAAGQNTVTFTVTAEDSTEKVYTVNINQGVTDNYGWKADDDFDGLIASGNIDPTSISSDETTMWVTSYTERRIYAHRQSDGTHDAPRDIPLHSDNDQPISTWSDGTTIWVADVIDRKLYAYNLADKSRQTGKELNLHSDNQVATGIYSDGTTMWVSDSTEDHIFAYLLATGSRQPSKEFNLHSENDRPNGIWSNGTTMWVLDQDDDKIYAYSHSTKARAPAQDLNTLTAAGNNLPSYITGNSDTMWVVDQRDRKIYSYNLPISNDATLDELTVSPKDIIGFSPDRFVYNVGVASTVERATIHTSATNNYAVVSTLSTDRDPGTPGHQINLTESTNGVLFTVTAQDTTTVKSYLVNINRGVSDPYGWKASDDLDGLIAADNEDPRGIAADTTTIWVVDHEDTNVYAYRKSNGTHDPSRDIPLHSDNQTPRGIWSNGTTLWVTDQNRTVYAYRISDKSRQSSNDFDVHSSNTSPGGIFSNGTTMWVTDNTAGKLFAYLLAEGTRQETKDFELHDDNGAARGIWSNGTTMWVTDQNDDKIYAYSHATRGRTADADFNTLSAADNNSPTALTGDGNTMWVVDSSDDKVYSYNGAISSDATLSALTVSPRDITGFDPGQDSYEVGLASTVTQATVTATANHPLSTVEMTPNDANTGTDGHQVNLSAGQNTVGVEVIAEDNSRKLYIVNINRGVTTPYGWKAVDDLDGLHAAGNGNPTGIWSNDTTIWVADGADDKLYAYNTNGTRDSDKDFDTLSAADNNNPYGLWSDGMTMWVLDDRDKKIYAYNMSTKARDASKDFETLDAAGNDVPLGIWSDGTTMWVSDFGDAQIYAYRMSDKSRDSSKEFNTLDAAGNDSPRGVWSDGTVMWVVDADDDKIYAYRVSDKARVSSNEFNTLTAASNTNPRVLWSDGTTMRVTDPDDDKVYSYNHPASDNADLKTLAVNSIEVSGFNPATTTYTLTVPDATREVTVSAEVLQFKAEITGITPPDADSRPGHQVTIDAAITPIVFTVTAQNGVTKRYTVNVNNDSLTEPPTILSAPDGNVDENAAPGQLVSTIRAIDPEGATPLTFTISQSDRASFLLVPQPDGTSAQLHTKVTFDHEAMRSGALVTILVSDPGGAKTSATVRVSINNVEEAGSVTIDPEPAALETEITATIEDPDEFVVNITWTWYRGDAAAGPWGSPINSATSDTYTPVAADVGKYLRAVASYTDDQGPGKTAEGFTAEAVLEFSDQTGTCNRALQETGDCDISTAGQLHIDRLAKGNIESGSDTDWFRFQMEADKIYRIDALAASTKQGDLLDPRLVGVYGIYQHSGSIYTYQADGLFNDPDDEMYAVWYDFDSGEARYLRNSYNDDGGEGLNARMYIRGFPAGTHYIEVTTVPHQENPADEMGSYTLTLTALEDDSSSDRTITVSNVESGEIEYPGDTDTFVVFLETSTEYFVQQILTGYWSGSHLINPKVENIHADPNTVVSTTYDQDDDADRFTTTTAGDYRITIAGYTRSHQRFATGTYTVQVSTVSSGSSSPLPNSPAVGVPTISGTAEYGETLTADASGVTDPDGIDRSTLAYQWLRNPGQDAAAISGATSRTYTVVADDEENQLSVRVSFTDNASNAESVTSAEVYIQAPPPLYSAFDNVPASHDGEDSTFTVEMYFNTEPSLSWRDVQNNVLTVTYVRRTNPNGDHPSIRWELTIEPTDDSDVTVLLPPTTDCTLDSAVCTARSSPLVNQATITISGPEEVNTNSVATGDPTISGTTTTGNTLTAVTSAITDTDGMDDATFSYQWLRNNVAISGATSSTYVLVSADEDNTIKVRVSFTDDEGNAETLTSAGTTATATAPTNSAATGDPTITGNTAVGDVLTAGTSAITDTNGLDSASFAYQWLRDDTAITDATSSTYTIAGEDEGHSIKVRVSFTDDEGFRESLTSNGLYIPIVPLEGFFDEDTVPASHGGLNTTFTFQLYFSVEPTLSFVDVRDDVLTLTNGDVTKVRRINPQSSTPSSRWEITVQPSGDSAVTVDFSPTTDCSANSAVCTSYGKMLSNSGSITVAGP